MLKLRTLIPLLALVVLVVAVSPAQYGQYANINGTPSHFYTAVFSKTYAANQSDTSIIFNVGGTRLADLYIVYNDSVNVITLVQKRTSKIGAWPFACGDTLNQTGGGVVSTSTPRTLTIRDATTDKLGGVGCQIRVITNFQATLCGVTTPTYATILRWKP